MYLHAATINRCGVENKNRGRARESDLAVTDPHSIPRGTTMERPCGWRIRAATRRYDDSNKLGELLSRKRRSRSRPRQQPERWCTLPEPYIGRIASAPRILHRSLVDGTGKCKLWPSCGRDGVWQGSGGQRHRWQFITDWTGKPPEMHSRIVTMPVKNW